MNTKPDSAITEADLHAYADGLLAPDRRAAVEAHLADNPDAAAEVANWQAQNAALRDAFGATPAADAEDQALIEALGRQRPRRFGRLAVAAGFALFFLAGGGAGSLITAGLQRGDAIAVAQLLPQASKTNYLVYASEVRHPVEVDASQEAHLVGWLGARIGKTLAAPDLSARGYALVGGRLVPFAEKPGAMLMYENAEGDRVTVLIGVNPDHHGTEFRFDDTDGVSTFFWADNGFAYAMSGAVDREALLGLAHVVYAQN